MNLKEQLIQLKNKLLGRKIDGLSDDDMMQVKRERCEWSISQLQTSNTSSASNNIIDPIFVSSFRKANLNEKVNHFIKKTYRNIIKDSTIPRIGFIREEDLRNFIEKMAVWYELRYPSYEVGKTIECSGLDNKDVSAEMFLFNPYIQELLELDEPLGAVYFDWNEFYNYDAFINSLPYNERVYLLPPRYSSIVNVANTIRFHLDKNGKIIDADRFEEFTKGKITAEQVLGKDIKEVYTMIKEKQIELPEDCEIEKCINQYNQQVKFKEGLLNCVMYRIIERGGNRVGPRRALMFAKEFDRNIDIPMQYGIDTTDPRLRYFINEYIKAGGTPELECYLNYFDKISATLKKTTIRDMIRLTRNDYVNVYTNEEKELHQGLVDVLSTQINPEELRKEQVKQLRLERKLKKSKQSR